MGSSESEVIEIDLKLRIRTDSLRGMEKDHDSRNSRGIEDRRRSSVEVAEQSINIVKSRANKRDSAIDTEEDSLRMKNGEPKQVDAKNKPTSESKKGKSSRKSSKKHGKKGVESEKQRSSTAGPVDRSDHGHSIEITDATDTSTSSFSSDEYREYEVKQSSGPEVKQAKLKQHQSTGDINSTQENSQTFK